MNLSSNKAKNRKILVRYVLILSTSLLAIFFILAGYNNILALENKLEYFIFPGKKIAEYEKLTEELIAIYGSGRNDYYRNDSYENKTVASAYFSQTQKTGNYIYIPKINVSAPVILGDSTDEKKILDQLKNGVLVYPGSSLPGAGGDTVIIGHSSSNYPWGKYSSVFASLPKLSKGDLIIVNFNGNKYAYNVESRLTGSVDLLANMDIKGDLVLGSCWPIGADEQRILITASLAR